MIYTIYTLFTLLGVVLLTRHWISGEDFKMEAKSFSMFVCLAVIEGLMMVTTLIPPSAGLFAGILFGIWMWRHILSARAILQEKVIKNEKMLVSIGLNVLFFVLVSVSYLS